jgi:ATP-dependent RNA helicase RhlE
VLTTDETQHAGAGFASLGLNQTLLDTVAQLHWQEPTPIQLQAIPVVLSGQDLFGVAQTGTGKTAAFALPILNQLSALAPAPPLKPYCVILAPTRELVQQIADQFEVLAAGLNLRILIAHGGTSDRPQTAALAAGVEVVVGAPGRVFDLMKQGYLQYAELKYTVLDEADRMFDMGFIDEIRNILNRMPARRQTLMFSATLPQVVKRLAEDYLCYPAEIRIGTTGPPKELNHEIWPVRSDREKEQALQELLDQEHECVLMFCRTKLGAAQLARMLSRWGEKVAAIHGDRLQSERERALDAFRGGRIRILVGTDVASRGLDIEGIDLVLNYDVPRDPEDYVHRVGRTARAKRSGIAVTFVQPDEERYVKRIEQFIKAAVPRRGAGAGKPAARHEAHADERAPQPAPQHPKQEQPSRQRSSRGRGGSESAPRDAQPAREQRPARERQAGRPEPTPKRPADAESTYIEDDHTYIEDTRAFGEGQAPQPPGGPRRRSRGSRGGRGRKRGGSDQNAAPPDSSRVD